MGRQFSEEKEQDIGVAITSGHQADILQALESIMCCQRITNPDCRGQEGSVSALVHEHVGRAKRRQVADGEQAARTRHRSAGFNFHERERERGRVTKIVDKGRGYGFIEVDEDYSDRVFFAFDECDQGDYAEYHNGRRATMLRDLNRFKPGARVTFRLGDDERKPGKKCAKAVRVEEPSSYYGSSL